MARKKSYDEKDVIEKALSTFWREGYEGTSTRMLEKEMGINQFSIYSSFENKHGVYMSCLSLYKQKIRTIIAKLEEATQPVEAIKDYFYDFLEFSKTEGNANGCFITNAINEFGTGKNQQITEEAFSFTDYVKSVFINNLKLDQSKDEATVLKQADYLLVALAGLSLVSKTFDKQLIDNYIENTFMPL